MRNLALIPLRGGSKSIPLKNIKPIAGRPLAFWVLDAALNSEVIHTVLVATDSEEIKETIRAYKHPKLEIIGRSPESTTDTAPTEMVMLEVAEKYEFDYLFLIQATSPLLKTQDLNEAFEKFKSSGADSLLSLVRQKHFIWKEKNGFFIPLNYDPKSRPRRQDSFEGILIENGAFYITSKKNLLQSKCRISGKITAHIMDEAALYEVDEPRDWKIIENLLQKNYGK